MLFEITDAVIQTSAARSYAELSLAPCLTRQWPSLYSALADGAVDVERLRALCLQQAPREQLRLHLALDVMSVRRMHSPNDRLLYQLPQTPPKGEKRKRRRRQKYGPKFRIADPRTWTTPNEVLEFEDPKFGRVRLELWSPLRFRVKEEVVDISVVRSQIHLERGKPPAPHWHGARNGTTEETTLARAFERITHRWPIEPANWFRKERLYNDRSN